MPVVVLPIETKFYNEFKNDVGFVSNLSDFTNNLTGSVMGKVKVSQNIDVSWSAIGTSADRLDVDASLLTITRTGGGKWEDDGFAVGDTFDLLNYTNNEGYIFTGLITSMSNNVIVFTTSAGTPVTTTLGYANAEVKGLTPLTASVYKFALLENSESYNSISKVSDNEQAYYGSDIGFDTGGGVRDTNFVNLTALGQYNDWVTGSLKIRYVNNPTTYVQRFEIEHEFTINPYYLEGELSNLQNNIIPTLFNGFNSLKYSYSPGFRTVQNNPNTEKKVVVNNNLGSVAWFNENFNGYDSDYSIVSVDYEELLTSNSADGILIGSETKTTVVVERLSAPFVGAERFGAYISYLPEQAEYQDTITSQTANFIYDRALNNAGLPTVAGDDFLTSLEGSVVAGQLVIEITTDYSATQKAFLANKFSQNPTYFMIGVEVGDVSLTAGNSDRVMLLADVNLYDESADIPDLMNVTKFDFYQHNKYIGVDAGTTDLIMWNEDGIAVNYEFSLNLAKQAFLNNLEFRLVAYNDVTGQMFELDDFVFQSVGASIVSSGVQQLNINTNRGYNLASGSQFNEASLVTDALVLQEQFYSGVIGQKISWQEWLLNNNVDTVFYNVNKPNNNLNFKTSNYSNLNDYTIRALIYANLDGVSDLGVSGNTNYFFLSPNLITHDYDKDGNVTPVWSAEIKTYHPNTLVDLQGAVLSGTNTLMVTTWTNVVPVVDISSFWAVHRIEETGQPSYVIDELSTVNAPPVPNRLIPLIGETLLKMDIVSGTVVTQCLVDGSQIISGQSYNLSARINDDTKGTPLNGKMTEGGILKATEELDFKIIE